MKYSLITPLLIQTCFAFALGIFTTLSLLERPVWRLMWRPMDDSVPDAIARTIHADLKRLIPLLPPTMVLAMALGAVLLMLQAWHNHFELYSSVILGVFLAALAYLLIQLQPHIKAVRDVPSDGPIDLVRTGLGRLAALHHIGLATAATVEFMQLIFIGPSL